MNFRFAAAFATLAIAFAAPASAATISTLFNTGTDASNTSVAGVGIADQHWSLGIESAAYVSGQNGVFPIGPWLADTSASRWITPTPTAGDTLDPTADGTYTYTLRFALDGYKAATAAFTGRFAADNEVLGIVLNGTTLAASGGGFTGWTSFDSTGASFIAGTNTLSFRVSNFGLATGNPSGLRVEIAGTAATVPEPQSWVLLVAGFGLVGVAARRRSKTVAA